MKTRKCGLYIRVSTLRQASVEDGSLKAQEAKLKAYINYENSNKGNWEIYDIYREEGRSAKNLNRPQFQRLMQINQRVESANRHGFFDRAEEILLLVGGQFRRRLF